MCTEEINEENIDGMLGFTKARMKFDYFIPWEYLSETWLYSKSGSYLVIDGLDSLSSSSGLRNRKLSLV